MHCSPQFGVNWEKNATTSRRNSVPAKNTMNVIPDQNMRRLVLRVGSGIAAIRLDNMPAFPKLLGIASNMALAPFVWILLQDEPVLALQLKKYLSNRHRNFKFFMLRYPNWERAVVYR